jgi:hypothetical protein
MVGKPADAQSVVPSLWEDHVVVSGRLALEPSLDGRVEVVPFVCLGRRVRGERGAAAAAVASLVVGSGVCAVQGRCCGGRVRGGARDCGRGRRGDSPVFAAAFDAFVRVLVQRGKVLPELLLVLRNGVSFTDGGKFVSEKS